MLLNTSDLTRFIKDGIYDTISFSTNQIKFLSQTVKENCNLMYMLITNFILSGFSPTMYDFSKFTHLDTMAVNIFDFKFIDNLPGLITQ